MIRVIDGDLIALAQQGAFDVIAHGCNCFCRMKRGIAPQMAAAFGCDKFSLEENSHVGEIDKLGRIEWNMVDRITIPLIIVNMYTQYHWENPGTKGIPLEYGALYTCLIKLNHTFRGKRIGLPKIGCGLAGGDWRTVGAIIDITMKNCNVTVVNYPPKTLNFV